MDLPPLFTLVEAPAPQYSTRSGAFDQPTECNRCGYARTLEEAQENNRAIQEAALAYANTSKKRTKAEAEGWLKLKLGERNVVWCPHCLEFSGECCADEMLKLQHTRAVRALFVRSVGYGGKWLNGSPRVEEQVLPRFYEALLDGTLVLDAWCGCEGGGACDSSFRACCHAQCSLHPQSVRGVIPQKCGCEEEFSGPPKPQAQLVARLKDAVRRRTSVLFST